MVTSKRATYFTIAQHWSSSIEIIHIVRTCTSNRESKTYRAASLPLRALPVSAPAYVCSHRYPTNLGIASSEMPSC